MGTYKFGRILAAISRVTGIFMLVMGVAMLFTGHGGLGLQNIGSGIAAALLGMVASAVFDIAEASRRGSLAGEPNYSLKRTSQSLRD